MDSSYNLFRRTTPDWMRVLIASAIAIAMLVLNGPPIVRDALAWAFVTPVQRVVHTARVWVADYLVHGYQVQSLALQNRDLVAQNEGYAMRLHTLASVEGDNQALRAQLGLKSSAPYPLISAEALYQVVDPYMRKLVLNMGSQNGVQLGQPVMTHEGLLGQITDVQINTAEVTLITDTKVNVPVMVQRNPSVRGFISGDKSEGFLELRIFNQESADLQKDDLLVTSGLDGLYPPNIPVAKVANIAQAGPDGRSELTVVPLVHALSVRYVGVIQVPNLAEMKARSDAQIELARENPVPSTLGARTREQFKK